MIKSFMVRSKFTCWSRVVERGRREPERVLGELNQDGGAKIQEVMTVLYHSRVDDGALGSDDRSWTQGST